MLRKLRRRDVSIAHSSLIDGGLDGISDKVFIIFVHLNVSYVTSVEVIWGFITKIMEVNNRLLSNISGFAQSFGKWWEIN